MIKLTNEIIERLYKQACDLSRSLLPKTYHTDEYIDGFIDGIYYLLRKEYLENEKKV